MSNLQWKQHKDTLTQIFKEYRRNNVATDVEIHCKGGHLSYYAKFASINCDFLF